MNPKTPLQPEISTAEGVPEDSRDIAGLEEVREFLFQADATKRKPPPSLANFDVHLLGALRGFYDDSTKSRKIPSTLQNAAASGFAFDVEDLETELKEITLKGLEYHYILASTPDDVTLQVMVDPGSALTLTSLSVWERFYPDAPRLPLSALPYRFAGVGNGDVLTGFFSLVQMKLPKKTIKVMLLVMPDALMPGSTETNSNMVILGNHTLRSNNLSLETGASLVRDTSKNSRLKWPTYCNPKEMQAVAATTYHLTPGVTNAVPFHVIGGFQMDEHYLLERMELEDPALKVQEFGKIVTPHDEEAHVCYIYNYSSEPVVLERGTPLMKVLHKVSAEEITVVPVSAILNSTLPPEDTPGMELLDIDDAKEDARKIAMELKSKRESLYVTHAAILDIPYGQCVLPGCGAEVNLKKGHLGCTKHHADLARHLHVDVELRQEWQDEKFAAGEVPIRIPQKATTPVMPMAAGMDIGTPYQTFKPLPPDEIPEELLELEKGVDLTDPLSTNSPETDLEFILSQKPYDWQMDSEQTTLIDGSFEDFVDFIAFLLTLKRQLIIHRDGDPIQPMKFKLDIEEKDGVTPLNDRMRSFSLQEITVISEQLSDMMKYGAISHKQLGASGWASSIVLVKKKLADDTMYYRLCLDLRGVNKRIKSMASLSPTLEQCLNAFTQDCNIFSSLDLKKAFWSLSLTDRAKKILSFRAPYVDPKLPPNKKMATAQSIFQCERMPFGLQAASSVFTQIMAIALEGTGVNSYIDDIPIGSDDFKSHFASLRLVAQRLKVYKLTLGSKCNWLRPMIDFLGFQVSKKGISTMQSKIQPLLDMKSPENKADVRTLVGFVQFYSRFLENLATSLVPMTNLLKKAVKFSWSEACEQGFNQIKQQLTSAPVLRFPDYSKRFILETDASLIAIGACLSQEFDDGVFPVAYYSKKLSETQQRWNATERELFAVMAAIVRFRPYLAGKQFDLRTDHQALCFLIKDKRALSAKLHRWCLALSQYDFTVSHKPGVEMGGPDALSRLVAAITAEIDREIEALKLSPLPASSSSAELRVAQLCPIVVEPPISSFRRYVTGEQTPLRGDKVVMPTVYLGDDILLELGETVPLVHGIISRKGRLRNDWVVTFKLKGRTVTREVDRRWIFPADFITTCTVNTLSEVASHFHDEGIVGFESGESSDETTPFLTESVILLDAVAILGRSHYLCRQRVKPQALSLVPMKQWTTVQRHLVEPKTPPRYRFKKGDLVKLSHSYKLAMFLLLQERKVLHPTFTVGEWQGLGRYSKALANQTFVDFTPVGIAGSAYMTGTSIICPRKRFELVNDQYTKEIQGCYALEHDVSTLPPKTASTARSLREEKEVGKSSSTLNSTNRRSNITESAPTSPGPTGSRTEETMNSAKSPIRDSSSTAIVFSPNRELFEQGYLADDSFAAIYTYLTTNVLPSDVTKGQRTSIQTLKQYTVRYKLLLIAVKQTRSESHWRVVIPKQQLAAVIYAYHDEMHHWGITRTSGLITQRFYSPQLDAAIRQYVVECPPCQKRRKFKLWQQKFGDTLGSLVSDRKCDTWSVDIVKLGKTPDGYMGLLIFTEFLTRYAVFVPIKDKTTATVARALKHHIIDRFSCMRVLLSDQGGEFNSKWMNDMLALFGIEGIQITKGNPRANGRLERINQTAINILAKAKADRRWKDDWLPLISVIENGYNSGYHRLTSLTPHFGMYMQDFNLPVDLRFGVAESRMRAFSPNDYLIEMMEAYKFIGEVTRQVMSKYYHERDVANSITRGKMHFEVGTLVMVADGTQSDTDGSKFTAHAGPYKVMSRATDEVYNISGADGKSAPIAGVRLRPYVRSSNYLHPPGVLATSAIGPYTRLTEALKNDRLAWFDEN